MENEKKILIKVTNEQNVELNLWGSQLDWIALLTLAIDKVPEFKQAMKLAIDYTENKNKN